MAYEYIDRVYEETRFLDIPKFLIYGVVVSIEMIYQRKNIVCDVNPLLFKLLSSEIQRN